MIHLLTRAPENPFLTLFERVLLFAYCEIAPDITNLVIDYYFEHATQWRSWKNVALNVDAEVVPFITEAVKISNSLPETVDVRLLLKDRSTRLKHSFTQRATTPFAFRWPKSNPFSGNQSTTTTDQPNEELENSKKLYMKKFETNRPNFPLRFAVASLFA